MMKKMIMIGMLGMVLIGLVSAGLIGFLSNRVSASVEVGGPTFYLDSTPLIYSSTSYRMLKTNDDNVNTSKLLLDKEENIWYVSSPLGVDNFYDERYNITLYLSAEELVNDSRTGTVLVGLYLENKLLCSTQVIGVPQGIYNEYVVECVPGVGVGLQNANASDRLILNVKDAPMGIRNKIDTENSKIVVTLR